MGYILLNSIFLGFILVSGRKCQEFMTLNVPPRAPFPFHMHEDLIMEPSETQPVFLYSSSQNDFAHQNLPERVVPNPPHQRQPNYQRHKFSDTSPPVVQKQRNNNGINIPPLTYGFQPKPSTRVQTNNPPKQNNQNQYENGRFNGAPARKPVFHEENRPVHQHQGSHFPENVRVHNDAHQDRRQTSGAPSNGLLNDPNQSFDYLSHILSHDSSFQMLTRPSSSRHGGNNPSNRNKAAENRKPAPSHDSQNHPIKVDNKEENGQKRTTFADTVQAFSERYNSRNDDATFPLKTFGGGSIQNFPEKRQQQRNNNERLNLQPHARSMRVDNRPQLPVRPLHNNRGIRINTVAGELPIFHVDPINSNNKNTATYVHSNNYRNQHDLKGQEKKTYLLIKAPPTTTEVPSLAPLAAETVYHASTPLFTDNLADDNVHAPEIFYSTPEDHHTVPENNLETPEVVLDLVQVPDPTVYSPHDKSVSHSAQNSEFRSAVPKDTEVIESIHPTEGYPTTPMHYRYDDLKSYRNDAYSLLPDDNYQNKMVPKPKIRDLKKPSNASDVPKMSFSSSVSIVSVKQSVDAKQASPRKPKTNRKKATPAKKKVKLPQKEDDYDDYDASQNVPGEAGVDYPAYKDIPSTRFDCKSIKSPGFYADVEAGCQVFHNCDTGRAKHSFMCPNGTIFHQELLICDWWYNVKCEDSPDSYSLNSGLYITDNWHDEFNRKA